MRDLGRHPQSRTKRHSAATPTPGAWARPAAVAAAADPSRPVSSPHRPRPSQGRRTPPGSPPAAPPPTSHSLGLAGHSDSAAAPAPAPLRQGDRADRPPAPRQPPRRPTGGEHGRQLLAPGPPPPPHRQHKADRWAALHVLPPGPPERTGRTHPGTDRAHSGGGSATAGRSPPPASASFTLCTAQQDALPLARTPANQRRPRGECNPQPFTSREGRGQWAGPRGQAMTPARPRLNRKAGRGNAERRAGAAEGARGLNPRATLRRFAGDGGQRVPLS